MSQNQDDPPITLKDKGLSETLPFIDESRNSSSSESLPPKSKKQKNGRLSTEFSNIPGKLDKSNEIFFEQSLIKPKEEDGGGDEYENDESKHVFELSPFQRFLNILFCRADLSEKKFDHKPVTLFALFRYAKTFDWFLIILGTFFALLAGIASPALGLLSGRITNVLILYSPESPEFQSKAYENVYIFVCLGFASILIDYFQFFCFQNACNRLIVKLKYEYVRAIIRQNSEWFDKNHSGKLTSTLNENIQRIQDGIGDKLGVLVRGISMLFAALIISLIYEWRLSLLMLVMTPLSCSIMGFQAQKNKASTMKELNDLALAGVIAEESIMGVRTVQAFNGQNEMCEKYKNELIKGTKHSIKIQSWNGILMGSILFLNYAFLGIGILYGSYLLKIGIMENPGYVFICITSQFLGSYYLGLISPHLMALLNARVAAAIIYETIDRIPKKSLDVYSSEIGGILNNPTGLVEIKNVEFNYPNRKNVKVLDGLNLILEPGKTIALVGHSGCGKSTIFGLLTRLYEFNSGSITIDGMNIKNLNINYLRKIIGIVQQEPALFNDTILENIKISNPEISLEKIIEIFKMANAHDFIEALPKGYSTLIGDGGIQLSGGQKQRIAIARVLARNPKILLLDEATSALDSESESIVQDALEKASKGRSTIIIAHRLSTVKNANKILVLDKGKIVEAGTHQELINLGGNYANLIKAQKFISSENGPIKNENLHRDRALSNISGREIFLKSKAVENSELMDFRKRAGSIISISSAFEDMDVLVASKAAVIPSSMKIADSQNDNNNYSISTIYKNAKGQYRWIIFGTIFALLRGLQLPASSIANTYVFKAFTLLHSDPNLMVIKCIKAVGMFFGIGIGNWLLQIAGRICFAYSSENLIVKFRVAAFRNILFQDGSFFDNLSNTPGKLITRLATDAPNIKSVVDSRMLAITYSCMTIIASMTVSFIYSWQIAVLGSILLFSVGFMEIFLSYKIMKINMKIAKEDEAGRTAIEIIENVKTIQLLTLENHFNNQYLKALKNQLKIIKMKCFLESANNCLLMSVEPFMYAACYGLGIYIISQGVKSKADIFQAVISMLMMAFSVTNSASFVPEIIKANSAAKLLFSMIFYKSKTGDSSVGEKPKLVQGNISFEKVSFSYPQKSNQPIMKNLNFNILSGKTIALVGPSGTGKSTIISLLERFYDISGGHIKIDGIDLREISLDYLRTQMALVGQEPRLFSGTIKENICFGLNNKNNEITEKEIEKVLEISNAKNFVYSLPAGMDTEVGEKGTQISGGQKQRIAIARALIRNPKILLLDEATSALDSESERAVQEALDKAREGRTCITIAHRLSSIQNSDCILYIENGRIQEFGAHQELISKKGKYFQLIKKQDFNQ